MTEPARRSRFPRFAGEFITIVLGVLVALGVDEWRETRAEARQEIAYYRALIEDLDRDIAEYEDAQAFIGVSIRAAEQVFSAIMGTEASAPFPTLAQAVQYASWVNLPAWSSGTLNELVNSGSIRLIREPEIKRAVLAYYDQIGEWKPRIQGPEFSAFIEYRTATAPLFSRGPAVWDNDRGSPATAADIALEPVLVPRLRGDEQLLGLTRQMIWQWRGIVDFVEGFQAAAVALRDQIAARLDESDGGS